MEQQPVPHTIPMPEMQTYLEATPQNGKTQQETGTLPEMPKLQPNRKGEPVTWLTPSSLVAVIIHAYTNADTA